MKKRKIPTIDDLLEPDQNGYAYLDGDRPTDPWGHAYRIQELEGRDDFEVVSWGPDGAPDTADDVVHPKRRED